jgi:hypothetical protein
MKGFIVAMAVSAATLGVAALLSQRDSQRAANQLSDSTPAAVVADRVAIDQVPQHVEMETTPAPAYPLLMGNQLQKQQSEVQTPAAQTVELAPGLTIEEEPRSSADEQASDDEKQTFKETRVSDTSLRNSDFPRTYISLIQVDLTSPHHWVRLTWSGPNAASQETGPFHSSPGRGLGYNNCDDVAESNRANSNCTPKGTRYVQAFSETMATAPNARFVTWFHATRGVAFHYYPDVPNYPASHGCVRLEDMRAAQLIHNNSKIGATEVVVGGKWMFRR